MPKGRILAVDDQRYFRELIEGLLREEGYEVQTASSGEEALRILDHGVFDVVVTDLVMPVMTGTDLVQRVKERDPDQEIMVVTGVVDVKSAVDAMKVGATDYLLKPFDRPTLARALESILQRSRLRGERDRLLAENIEFLGERSLFERALGLFSSLSIEALAQKVLDGLCQETGAQGGVLWLADDAGETGFQLLAGHGLVRLEQERERLLPGDLPDALRGGSATTGVADWHDPQGLPRPSLLVAMRRGTDPVGVIRLTDKLGGEPFDDVDRACAEKFVQFAETAYRNAERFRQLERRTLQDPDTGAYRVEYLQDVARNEIEKANRFGRSFGLMKVAVAPLEPLRERLDEAAFRAWHATLTRYLRRQLRATDLFACDEEGQFFVLLAESDALGAATFKQRTRRALEQGEPLAGVQADVRPALHLGCASYPGDATQLESLFRALDTRVNEDRRGRARDQRLAALPLPESLELLLEEAEREPMDSVASLVRFALSEVGRRPRERNFFFCHPTAAWRDALVEGLSLRREIQCGTDLVVLGEPSRAGMADEGVTWVAPGPLEGAPPFAVQFGDGPAYALVADPKPDAGGVRLLHTSDRALVEMLAFRLQRELQEPRL